MLASTKLWPKAPGVVGKCFRPTESDRILKRIPFILLWKGPWCLVLESQVKVSLACLPFPHPHFFVLASANEVKAQAKAFIVLQRGPSQTCRSPCHLMTPYRCLQGFLLSFKLLYGFCLCTPFHAIIKNITRLQSALLDRTHPG